MAGEALVIDSLVVPVLQDTWKETIFAPGSRARTETGDLRSVRLGCPVSVFVGQSLFAERADADQLRDLLLTYGEHTISGWLPGRSVVCETDCGPIEALGHRPKNVPPTAMWRLSWTLTQTHCAEESVIVGIMLITPGVGSTSANRVQAALVAAGHSVTQVDHDDFRTGFTDYTPFEVIVTCRINHSDGNAEKLREVINSGRGVVTMAEGQPDGVITPLLNLAGLQGPASYLWAFGAGKDIVVTDNSHPITAGFSTSLRTPVLSDDRKQQGLWLPVAGTILAICDPDNENLEGLAAIVVYEIGTVYLTEPFDPIPARVVFLGWAPEPSFVGTDCDLTADSILLLQRAVQWVL